MTTEATAEVPCPSCDGQGESATLLVSNRDGELRPVTCGLCKGARFVSPEIHAANVDPRKDLHLAYTAARDAYYTAIEAWRNTPEAEMVRLERAERAAWEAYAAAPARADVAGPILAAVDVAGGQIEP